MSPEGTVVFDGTSFKRITVKEFQALMSDVKTARNLVDRYVQADYHFWLTDDDMYDYAEGSKEYKRIYKEFKAWGKIRAELEEQVVEKAKDERLFDNQESGLVKKLAHFMARYGYQDKGGWWVRISSC